jgi:RNA polymerase sigma factor (sigma-70 family)
MGAEAGNITDESLVEQYRNSGNKQLVGLLFKRHILMCYAVCMKYLKDEDAAQDASMSIFEKLFEDLHSHEVRNFKSWLHSVCRNYCLMQLRKPSPIVRLDEPDEENESFFGKLEAALHQEDKDDRKEDALQALELAMMELKEQQRKCIELFYLQKKSYEEIGACTGYSSQEVKSHIQNGKRNLKIALNEKGITFMLVFMQLICQTT